MSAQVPNLQSNEVHGSIKVAHCVPVYSGGHVQLYNHKINPILKWMPKMYIFLSQLEDIYILSNHIDASCSIFAWIALTIVNDLRTLRTCVSKCARTIVSVSKRRACTVNTWVNWNTWVVNALTAKKIARFRWNYFSQTLF